MSRPTSAFPSSAPTPAPSSPPPSESFLSDFDGTAPSVLDTSGDFTWEPNTIDPTSLNLVSWKLDVNARAEDGVEKRGFNAISTVLNHPSRKANPLRSTRKPLPPLTQPPPVLPKPPQPSHYDPYLQTITPLYESFVAAQGVSSSSSRLNTPFIPDDIRSQPKTSLPPLQSVPELFFDPSFDLANPSTWSAVVEEPSAGPSGSSERESQDALSSHLDTLERHLIHEITLRSSAFFSALSNLQDLHSESASCLTRITELQTSLKDVGTKQAKKGLEVIDAQETLRVLRVTERGIKTVAELDELVKFARGLVEAGDWAGGLGCLDDVVKWWERYGLREQAQGTQESADDLPPLSTLPALSSLPDSVGQLINTIATQLESALSSLLSSVLSRTDKQLAFDKEEIRGQIEPMLSGVARCGKIGGIEEVWRDAITTSIREGSRKHLPVNQAEEEGDEEGRPPEARGANLAEALKSMDHSQFLLLSTEMYSTLLSRLQLAQQVGELIAEVISAAKSLPPISISSFVPDPPPVSIVSSEFSLDLTDVLASACELANNRASKILGVRAEQHASLSLEEFVEIFKENWEFVLATETIAKRMIVSLRGVTASQARAFLVSYHAVRLTKSANMVQEEQWTQVEIQPDVQHVVNILVDAAVSDPAECFLPAPESAKANGNGNGTSSALSKTLAVEDKSFFVVKATAESLTLLADYLKVVINLELVVTDVMSRIIEFLKSFNSRTCQVVLGAGAMRSAGLKNITAKHLALASQSLSVIVALIPYIREFIRRHLSPKQAVMLTEFDKLKRDYQEHQNEIHAKLVAIMSDRLAVHIGSLREIDWEAVPEKEGPRAYAEMLVKETATLHKVLSKYLAAQTVESVLSEVLAAIVHRLSEEYSKIELKSDEGKKRMSQDVALINARLSPLSESGKTVSSLETLVKDKPTPRRAIGQAMKGMLRRVNSGGPPKPDAEAEKENGDSEGEDGDEVQRKKSEEEEDGLTITQEPEEMGMQPPEADKDTKSSEVNGREEVKNEEKPNGLEDGPATTEISSEAKREDSDSIAAEPAFSEAPAAATSTEEAPLIPSKDEAEKQDKEVTPVTPESPEVPAKEEPKHNGEEVPAVPDKQ